MRYTAAAIAFLFAVSTATVLVPAGVAGAAEKKAEKEEQTVSPDQIPAPVKTTLDRESKGGTLGPVTMETEKGKTFYEAEIEKAGKKRYVHVSPEGKVLKRESTKGEAREEKRESK